MRNAYDYIEHGLFKPKYVAKVGKWPNARYFYSDAEYQTYLKGERQLHVDNVKRRSAASLRNDSRDIAVRREEHKKYWKRFNKLAAEGQKVADQHRIERENAKPFELVIERTRADYLTGHSARKTLRDVTRNYKKSIKAYNKATKKADKYKAQLDRLKNKNSPKYQKTLEAYNQALASASNAKRQSNAYSKQMERAMMVYSQTTLPGITSEKIKSGQAKLTDLIKSFGNTALAKLNPTMEFHLKRKK